MDKLLKTKKAQTEVIGLAIIIVLVALGLLFFFKFSSTKSKDTLRQDFTDSKLASNMINVILKTTLDCKDIEIKNLYMDCAEGVSNIDYCGENNPCEKAGEVVEYILERTLKVWQKSYSFTATIGEDVKTSIVNEGCTKEGIGTRYSSLESSTYPIPTDKGSMLVKLDICRK